MRQDKQLRHRSKNILLYLFFVAIATGVWIGHAMSSVRNVTLPIEVKYTGVADNIAFGDTLPRTFLVKIRDTGQRLRIYHKEPPVMEFDLTNQLSKNQGSIHITQEMVRRSLTDQIRGTSHVQEIIPAEFQTTYFHEQEREVPIVVDATFSPASQYQIQKEATPASATMKIYGKKGTLDKVKAIHTEAKSFSNLRDSISVMIPLVCPEGVRPAQKQILVTVVTEKFTEKTMTRPIQSVRVPENAHLQLFPQEATVTFHVPLAHFADVTEDDITLTCSYPTTKAQTLQVEVHYNNPYISNLRISPTEVEYLIQEEHKAHMNE